MITLGSSLPDMPGGQALLNAAGAIVGLAVEWIMIRQKQANNSLGRVFGGRLGRGLQRHLSRYVEQALDYKLTVIFSQGNSRRLIS